MKARCTRARGTDTGSTLIEVLVAMFITITGVVAMAQMFRIAAVGTASARDTTLATMFAGQKVEELRADSRLSPAGTLQGNTRGYVDHLDAQGHVIGDEEVGPPLTVYTRRWSVELPPAQPGLQIVQVLVTRHRNRGRANEGNVGRLPDEARVVAVTAGAAP